MHPGDFEVWLRHFEHHAERTRSPPRGLEDVLSAAERRLIGKSMATFQLGESSDGRRLLQAARRFAAEREAAGLVRIVELLIREERQHAAALGAFMQDHRIALETADWTDRVFRYARRCAGLELYLCVLLAAELIGIVYYRALETAQGICA
jgi:hypothetical protein